MTATDQQIRDGLARLTSALAPPPDTTGRVARRISARRHRRRAGLAGCGLAAITVVGAAAVMTGGDDTGTVAVDPASPDGSLLLTRPDGSTFSFADVAVECGEEEPGRIAVLAQSPRHGDDSRLLSPLFYMAVDLRSVELGRTYDLPLPERVSDSDPFVSDSDPFIVFVADAGTSDEGNEVSSSQPGAAGTVRVVRASCDPLPTLHVELDATLGSEVGQGTLHVSGTLD